jgi:phosphatidylglycerol---prolipoprotein diacylglyceryl transferase
VLPEIDLGGISLKTFGLFFALNFVAWGLLAARRLKELGKPVDWAWEMVLVALAGGLVGARAYYLLQNYSDVKGDVFGSLLSGGGLVWYGGLLGGVLAVVAWAWWRKFLSLALLDIGGPCLALGYAIGRIGCQVSGDGDYGKPSDAPWAMPYPDGEVPTNRDVLPTPIFETVTMGLLAWALWRLRDRVRPGGLMALYLVGAGLERFVVEFWRRNTPEVVGLTVAQVWALGLLAAGLVWLALLLRGGPLVSGPGRAARPATA